MTKTKQAADLDERIKALEEKIKKLQKDIKELNENLDKKDSTKENGYTEISR